MFDNDHIPTIEEAKTYFRKHGVKEEVAIKWWNRQQQFNWVSKFPYTESADRWIAHAAEDERLPPRKPWLPFGKNAKERLICAQEALRREREIPGTYTDDQLDDIESCIESCKRELGLVSTPARRG